PAEVAQVDVPKAVPGDVTSLDVPKGRKADLADTADDIPVIRLDDTVSDIEPIPADPGPELSALGSGSSSGAGPVAGDPSAESGAGSGDSDAGATAAAGDSSPEPSTVGPDTGPVSPYARTRPIVADPGASPAPGAPGAPDMPWVRRGSRRRDGDRGRRRMIGIGALVVVVLAAAGTGIALASGGGGDKTPAVAASSSPAQNLATGDAGKGGGLAGASASSQATAKASPTAGHQTKPHKAARPAKPSHPAVPVRALTVSLAQAFGPDGPSDGDNPQSAMNVVSPSSSQPWSTDWYTSAEFGMLKQGTGLLLDMGSTVTITNVQVNLGPDAGTNVQVLAGNEPALSGMHLAASVNGAGGATDFRLRSPRSARYVLVWFTKLPPSNTGQYQASVYSVVVVGRR
ncbi:MAG: hypothetical protein ACRDN0_07300, partial [Trebonia sp.]